MEQYPQQGHLASVHIKSFEIQGFSRGGPLRRPGHQKEARFFVSSDCSPLEFSKFEGYLPLEIFEGEISTSLLILIQIYKSGFNLLQCLKTEFLGSRDFRVRPDCWYLPHWEAKIHACNYVDSCAQLHRFNSSAQLHQFNSCVQLHTSKDSCLQLHTSKDSCVQLHRFKCATIIHV